MGEFSNHPILQSKLYPPRIPSDYVYRSELQERLEENTATPLILISAPAGYGKSSLISNWLRFSKKEVCWISLGAEENSYYRFVQYLIASLRQNNVEFGEEIEELLSLLGSSDSVDVTKLILNQLNNVERQLAIVLDDYHLINRQEIHALIETHALFPAKNLQFILISRNDPPLPLHELRLKNKLFELRRKDLAFDPTYTQEYFKKAKQLSINQEEAANLSSLTEGWVSGLKMISLTEEMPAADKLNPAKLFPAELVKAFLLKQDPFLYDLILLSSSLRQFNSALITAILPEDSPMDGEAYISYLRSTNLFLISLDEQRVWFRFHHFFGDLLQQELDDQKSQKEINQFYLKVATWFRSHSLAEFAISYYLKSGSPTLAYDVFLEHRLNWHNERDWGQIETILQLFNTHKTTTYIGLQLSDCWLKIQNGQVIEMFEQLPAIEQNLFVDQLESEREYSLEGEFKVLMLYRLYNYDHDYKDSLDLCKNLQDLIPENHFMAASYYWIFYGASLQVVGRTSEAFDKLGQAWDLSENTLVRKNILLIQCYIHYVEGQQRPLLNTATMLLGVGTSEKNQEAIAEGNLFLGMHYYLQGKLDRAINYLEEVDKRKNYIIGPHKLFNATALSAAYFYAGYKAKFSNYVERQNHYFNSSGGQVYRVFWQAHYQEFNGRFNNELQSAPSILDQEFTLVPISNHTDPNLIQIRLMLDQDNLDRKIIAAKIDRLESFVHSINGLRVLQSLSIAKAILLFRTGAESEAQELIIKVLAYIKLSGNLMILVEYHKSALPLIMATHSFTEEYRTILNNVIAIIYPAEKIELTRRESEILEKLDLSNNEIAETLFISEKTVKRHKNGIFKKLGVKNSREAIAKAKQLDLAKF